MMCHKQGCEFYDVRMTDNCSKGEPPDVEHCGRRMGSKRGLKTYLDSLRAEITSLRSSLQTARAEGMEEAIIKVKKVVHSELALWQRPEQHGRESGIAACSAILLELDNRLAIRAAIPVFAEGCRGVYFVTLMRRWGNLDGHTYPAGVHLTLEEAIKRGEEERLDRAGKYEFQVWQGDRAGGVIVHDTCGDQTEHWQATVKDSLQVAAIPAAEVCDHSVDSNEMVCEWEERDDGWYEVACQSSQPEWECRQNGEVCPYCGRPIKVKE